MVAGIDGDAGALLRVNPYRIQFEIRPVRRAVGQNLEEILKAIIFLVLFSIFDHPGKEILCFWVNRNCAAQSDRPQAALLSVRNDTNCFPDVRNTSAQYDASHEIGASNPYRLLPAQIV